MVIKDGCGLVTDGGGDNCGVVTDGGGDCGLVTDGGLIIALSFAIYTKNDVLYLLSSTHRCFAFQACW